MNRTRIIVAHVDKRLCVFDREAGNQAIVKCQSIVKFNDRWNSSVTHDIVYSYFMLVCPTASFLATGGFKF